MEYLKAQDCKRCVNATKKPDCNKVPLCQNILTSSSNIPVKKLKKNNAALHEKKLGINRYCLKNRYRDRIKYYAKYTTVTPSNLIFGNYL